MCPARAHAHVHLRCARLLPSRSRLAHILPAPIAYPTAKLLDYVLGKDETHTYKKAELK